MWYVIMQHGSDIDLINLETFSTQTAEARVDKLRLIFPDRKFHLTIGVGYTSLLEGELLDK